MALTKDRHYYVYIITNRQNTTLYIGMTSDLHWRLEVHRRELVEGFSKKYKLKKLVYYEVSETRNGALERERQLKNWKREWKLALIREKNPAFRDLSEGLFGLESRC